MSRPKIILKIPKKQLVDGNTKFYIDYTWWDGAGRSLESYLQSKLGTDVPTAEAGGAVDLIDMQTGEVQSLSGFEYAIQTYFNQQSADFMQRSSLVDGVFSALLSNGNRPMRALDIAKKVNRPSETICRTFGGRKIHLGIRPYTE